MAINICLYREDGKDHPDWDFLRQGNDRNFPNLIDWDKTVTMLGRWGDEGFRPTDLEALKERILQTGWPDKDRYLHLVKILEDEPRTQLHFSY